MKHENKLNSRPAKIAATGFIVAGLIFLVYKVGFTSSNNSAEFKSILPPVKSVDLPFNEYSLQADSSASIRLSTGTCIHIDPNTFTKTGGGQVKEKVVLKVREFHHAEDILRSGIPMSTDDARNNFLASAGMIELRAFSDGSSLEIQKGKSVLVDLAGYKPSEGYNLYYLENDKNWIQTGDFKPGINIEKSANQKTLDSLIENKPGNDSLDRDFYFNLAGSIELAPYLKPFQNQDWLIKSKDLSPLTIESMRVNWDNVQVKVINRRKMKCELYFTKEVPIREDENEKKIKKEFTVTAYPVMSGLRRKDARKALEDQMTAYEDILMKMEKEKERMACEADLCNSFRMNQMGVWNVDKVIDTTEFIYTSVSFDFEKNNDMDVSKIKLYVVYEEMNSVIPYNKKEWKKVAFSKNKKMYMVAVLPDDVIAIVKQDEISNALKSTRQNMFFETQKTDAKKYFAVR